MEKKFNEKLIPIKIRLLKIEAKKLGEGKLSCIDWLADHNTATDKVKQINGR